MYEEGISIFSRQPNEKYSISFCLEMNLVLAKLREMRSDRPSCSPLNTHLYLKMLSLKILQVKTFRALILMTPLSH